MAIKGLTDGPASFPRIGKLRKGAPKSGNRPGQDLDYFRFDSSDPIAGQAFKQAYGEQPREINVLLRWGTVEENFQTAMEQYGAGGIEIRCDRENIQGMRVNGKFLKCLRPTPCQRKGNPFCDCKEVGRLNVIIPELKRFAYVTVETHSINDIVNLNNQLSAIQATFGRLNGIPLVLRRRPEMISTPSGQGKRARREKWMLSIEVSPQWSALQLEAAQNAALQQAQIFQLEGASEPIIEASDLIEDTPEPISPRALEPVPTVDYHSTELWYSIKSEFHLAQDSNRIQYLTQLVKQRIESGELPENAQAGLNKLIEDAYDRLASSGGLPSVTPP